MNKLIKSIYNWKAPYTAAFSSPNTSYKLSMIFISYNMNPMNNMILTILNPNANDEDCKNTFTIETITIPNKVKSKYIPIFLKSTLDTFPIKANNKNIADVIKNT